MSAPRSLKVIGAVATAGLSASLALLTIDDAMQARAVAIAVVCLTLWLTEIVPSFVPTLIIAAAVPFVLGPTSPRFALGPTLAAGMDPVMVLFFGGFVLAAAARRHGVDVLAARAIVRMSRGNQRALILLLAGTSAVSSMWMSNVAAAALLLQVIRPLVDAEPPTSSFRRAALLAIAFGANFGGMATPIGSGPNAIAVAHVAPGLSFVQWLVLALPLALLLVAAACVIILVTCDVRGAFAIPASFKSSGGERSRNGDQGRQQWVLASYALCIVLWLTEPLHGVSAAIVALGVAALLFATRLVDEDDLAAMDWSTLLLIAGGLVLGRTLETAGLLAQAGAFVAGFGQEPRIVVALFVLVAALSSALMSNTATATLLIPLALATVPGPSTAVLVAIGCSLGAPFAISTPPNAMVAGAGVRARYLALVGVPLMILGWLLVAATGRLVLRLFDVG